MVTARQRGVAIRLPERFTVETAAEVLADAAPRIRRCKRLRIDMADVATADTAGLQLLAVLRRDLLSRGRECEICGASASVRDSAHLLGLDELLELA